MRAIPRSWSWQDLEYPVQFEFQRLDDKWVPFYKANNPEECQYRLSSYGLGTNIGFKQIRIIEANGTICFRHTKAQMDNFNREFRASVKKATQPLKTFVNASPKESIETAIELVTGALASQHFTIPRDSVVKLNHQVIDRITIQEFHDCVISRIHIINDPSDLATPAVTFWKDNTYLEFLDEKGPYVIPEFPCQPKMDGPGFAFTPYEVHNDIKGFLILLCAAIIRDFWVLEERSASRAYIKHTKKTRERKGRGKDRKLEIKKDYTFIPRFQYNLESYKVNKTIQHQTRVSLSPHLVSGHLRVLPEGWESSEKAQENATEFGITLKEGTTFVMPHQRGAIEQLRTYRSRSALQMLFGETKNEQL